MRKLKVLFTALLLSLFVCTAVSAQEEFDDANSFVSVQDLAGILTEDEYTLLLQRAESLKQAYDFGFYLVAVESMEDFGYTDIEDFSEYVFDYLDYGVGYEKNGIMLVLSMEDRDYDICAHGSMGHRVFTDYGKDKLAKESFLPYFKNDEWAEGFDAFLIKAGEYYITAEESEPIDVYSSSNRRSSSSDPIGFVEFLPSIGIAALISLVISLIICFILRASMKSVKLASEASDYINEKNVGFTERMDRFTHRDVVRHKIEKPSSGSGGGTHISSGGFSHSSGKF